VDLSTSYETTFADLVRVRYDWCEVRNAANIIRHTSPTEFADIEQVLAGFTVETDRDITPAGGNETLTAAHLNSQFRARRWREGNYRVGVTSELRLLPYKAAGEKSPTTTKTESVSESYLVDNVKGRIALDVEWHAKDGNLDRDISAYRALYDAGIIDGAVIVTMNRTEMRQWALDLDPASKKFATSTTTNLEKAVPRLTRGDGGGCPILVAAICRRTV
jgi:hypothetical protein